MSLGGCENDVSLFSVIHQAMLEDQLVDKVAGLSADVATQAQKLNGFKSVRTSGTSVWVDCDSHETTKNLVAHLRANGVLVQQNGSQGIIAKPALIAGQS
jgi:acetylornithine/succinyldiaminopimelate/putrescine aminotransferase|tara:strand:+ start:1009 stop:1308 length:300 start_codon:yes stop_codon:yes gene_type:complete